MTTMTQPVPIANAVPPAPATTFDNGQQWIESLGDVPLSRVIFDPWPGMATEADLLRHVEGEKRLCELVDRTLVEKPVGSFESLVAMRLGTALTNFAEPRDLGLVLGADATLRMALGNIRLPDVVFIRNTALPGGQMPMTPVAKLRLAIAVEVRIVGNTPGEMRRKNREYFESGSELVWHIDPRTRTAAVFTGPTDEPARTMAELESIDGGTVLPGFSVALSYLFRGPARPPSDQG